MSSRPAAAARRFRLAVVASHPIQYHVPLYRAMAAHARLDPTVFFCSRAGAETYLDPEFGRAVRWDRPLLDGYRHVFVPNRAPRPGPGRTFGLINPGLVPALVRGRFDAAVIPGYAVVSYALAYLGAWLGRTPVLFRGETALRPGQPWAWRLLKGAGLRVLFRATAACLTIGQRSHAFYRHHGVPEERLFFTPYTVDNDFFQSAADALAPRRAALRAEFGLPGEGPVVLFAGKLVPRKRPLDLVEAVARLAPPPALLVVGDGPLRDALRAAAARLGLAHVATPGFLNQSELPRAYAAADLLALPSEHEVAPLVLNEAMCAGLALVVSDAVPSAADLVEAEPGGNGYLHACGDVASLARALEAALSSPEHLRRLGRRSREKIADWSQTRVLEGLLAALERHARRAGPETT